MGSPLSKSAQWDFIDLDLQTPDSSKYFNSDTNIPINSSNWSVIAEATTPKMGSNQAKEDTQINDPLPTVQTAPKIEVSEGHVGQNGGASKKGKINITNMEEPHSNVKSSNSASRMKSSSNHYIPQWQKPSHSGVDQKKTVPGSGDEFLPPTMTAQSGDQSPQDDQWASNVWQEIKQVLKEDTGERPVKPGDINNILKKDIGLQEVNHKSSNVDSFLKTKINVQPVNNNLFTSAKRQDHGPTRVNSNHAYKPGPKASSSSIDPSHPERTNQTSSSDHDCAPQGSCSSHRTGKLGRKESLASVVSGVASRTNTPSLKEDVEQKISFQGNNDTTHSHKDSSSCTSEESRKMGAFPDTASQTRMRSTTHPGHGESYTPTQAKQDVFGRHVSSSLMANNVPEYDECATVPLSRVMVSSGPQVMGISMMGEIREQPGKGASHWIVNKIKGAMAIPSSALGMRSASNKANVDDDDDDDDDDDNDDDDDDEYDDGDDEEENDAEKGITDNGNDDDYASNEKAYSEGEDVEKFDFSKGADGDFEYTTDTAKKQKNFDFLSDQKTKGSKTGPSQPSEGKPNGTKLKRLNSSPQDPNGIGFCFQNGKFDKGSHNRDDLQDLFNGSLLSKAEMKRINTKYQKYGDMKGPLSLDPCNPLGILGIGLSNAEDADDEEGGESIFSDMKEDCESKNKEIHSIEAEFTESPMNYKYVQGEEEEEVKKEETGKELHNLVKDTGFWEPLPTSSTPDLQVVDDVKEETRGTGWTLTPQGYWIDADSYINPERNEPADEMEEQPANPKEDIPLYDYEAKEKMRRDMEEASRKRTKQTSSLYLELPEEEDDDETDEKRNDSSEGNVNQDVGYEKYLFTAPFGGGDTNSMFSSFLGGYERTRSDGGYDQSVDRKYSFYQNDFGGFSSQLAAQCSYQSSDPPSQDKTTGRGASYYASHPGTYDEEDDDGKSYDAVSSSMKSYCGEENRETSTHLYGYDAYTEDKAYVMGDMEPSQIEKNVVGAARQNSPPGYFSQGYPKRPSSLVKSQSFKISTVNYSPIMEFCDAEMRRSGYNSRSSRANGNSDYDGGLYHDTNDDRGNNNKDESETDDRDDDDDDDNDDDNSDNDCKEEDDGYKDYSRNLDWIFNYKKQGMTMSNVNFGPTGFYGSADEDGWRWSGGIGGGQSTNNNHKDDTADDDDDDDDEGGDYCTKDYSDDDDDDDGNKTSGECVDDGDDDTVYV